MKTLLAMAALAAVIATPAFAQTGTRRVQAAEHPSQFDQTVGRTEAQPRSAAQGTTVYDNNHYLGADPDPNVRLDLRRVVQPLRMDGEAKHAERQRRAHGETGQDATNGYAVPYARR